LVSTFEENTYTKEIGLGVYDIHSPRVPSVDELKHNINRALKTISPKQFWVNPDCGLKTRKEDETISALKVMVQAAKEIRERLNKNKHKSLKKQADTKHSCQLVFNLLEISF